MDIKPRYKTGEKISGIYKIHQVLMGGMGEVYLCLDMKSNLPFALKTFQARYLANLKLRELFRRETATWIALEKHPNIVHCYFMEIYNNQPFMVLEWIAGDEYRGSDLRGWLKSGPLDLRLALDFTIDICRGLVHANQKKPGIVHRDLKPENILVTRDRIAKITDFGLAKIVQEAGMEIIDTGNNKYGHKSLTGKGGISGTPNYMAPEQWGGEVLDQRTDIYAAGCILYEMMTGILAFKAASQEDLRRQHLEAKIPAVKNTQINPNILNRLISRCLAKRREDRFENINDLLSQLTSIYREQFNQSPKSINLNQSFNYIEYTNRGITYFNLKLYKESLVDLNKALELNSTDPNIYDSRGLVYYELGRLNEAIADFKKALRLDPGFSSAYSGIGNVYDKMGNYEEAIRNYSRAIELEPDIPEFYSNRGNTYEKLKRFDDALLDLNTAISLAPINAKPYVNRGLVFSRQGRYEEALKDFTEAIRLDPVIADTFSERGVAYLRMGHLEEALSDFDRAIELDPSFSLAYANRGIVFRKYQRYENALSDFAKALQIDPTYTFALLERANTYIELQRYDEALQDFSTIIKYEPENANIYYKRGQIYLKRENFQECLSDFTNALQLDPENYEILHDRGLVYFNLNQLRKALDDLNSAIRYNTSSAEKDVNRGIIYRSRAYIFCHLEQWNDALTDFNQAIEFDPENHQLYRDRGHLYDKLENFEEAIKDYSRAIQLEPKSVDYYLQRGNLYCKVGQYEEAINDFNYTLRFHPINPKSYLYLGMLFFNRRLLKEALFYFEMAAGNSQEGQYLVKIVRKQLNIQTEPELTQAVLALATFLDTSSVEMMAHCVKQFPFMTHFCFFTMIDQLLSQDKLPQQYRTAIEQRFPWLKDVANDQTREEKNQ